jgi:BirA family transcriptional regulator, biotin operon repressor / biotin---[acetyl-CoA-carboxylase] ligase
MHKVYRLLIKRLNNGNVYTGRELSKKLHCSLFLIYFICKQLQKLGVPLISMFGKGYKLDKPVELLNLKKINSYIELKHRKLIKKIFLFDEISSTNDYLKSIYSVNPEDIYICLAEYQSRGRGRRGRSWVSPFASNIYFSMLRLFLKDMSELSGLSLVIAMSVYDVLIQLGVKGIGLKWPNDILWQKRKLVGILVENVGEAHGSCQSIIGIGINVHMPKKMAKTIDQPWVDLEEILAEKSMLIRNQLVGYLINDLMQKLSLFEKKGMTPFRERWVLLDQFFNQKVIVSTPTKTFVGMDRGIDANGYFLLEDAEGKMKIFATGEISLRIA